MSIAFQAYGNAGKRTAESPRAAALAYFQAFPNARRCNVIEGRHDGQFFTVRYGRSSEGDWPMSYNNVTKGQAHALPEGVEDRLVDREFSNQEGVGVKVGLDLFWDDKADQRAAALLDVGDSFVCSGGFTWTRTV